MKTWPGARTFSFVRGQLCVSLFNFIMLVLSFLDLFLASPFRTLTRWHLLCTWPFRKLLFLPSRFNYTESQAQVLSLFSKCVCFENSWTPRVGSRWERRNRNAQLGMGSEGQRFPAGALVNEWTASSSFLHWDGRLFGALQAGEMMRRCDSC